MHSIRKAGIVCCSNALPFSNRLDIRMLCKLLAQYGIETVWSDLLYSDTVFCGDPQQRAAALMQFYQDDSITDIFDVSGGDLANSMLPYLDYDDIAASHTRFWGYSDLTVILNAVYAKTGKTGILYQIRNLLTSAGSLLLPDFCSLAQGNADSGLLQFPYDFVQGDCLDGIVIGGNIRCFLKLAGTPYMPNFSDKILLLEARSGTPAQMFTYLAQLQQLGAFEQISGILLGTFTQMQREHCVPDIVSLVQSFSGSLPLAVTPNIGHAADSHAIEIGAPIHLARR